MDKRQFGNTELMVSRLGAGLSEIGSRLTFAQESQASEILNTALDQGINFFDTAACYGISEELVGRTISARRDEFYLSTKAGHVVEDDPGPPWTYRTVADSIERSLRRLKMEYVDIVHLHSCDVDILEEGEVIRALQDAKQAGKTRYIGYSGDNEPARWAVESGLFDSLQTSYNLVDQQARKHLFSPAREQGMGIIVKRPIANAAWGADQSPSGYASEYFHRYQVMIEDNALPAKPEEPVSLALGFVFAHEAVDTAIVGTSKPEHMRKNIHWVENDLPVDQQLVEKFQRRFDEVGADWSQMG